MMTRGLLQYAGNVLVYGAVSPCDGDWYGGVTAEAAVGFLDALTGADISGHGGVSEAALKPLWRGRMGLSKDEQLQVCQLLIQHVAHLDLAAARVLTLVWVCKGL